MKTTRNLSIRTALLSTIAVAGLIAGTVACGGKGTETSAEVEIANIIEETEPNLVAQVLPEIDAELDAPNVTAPETAVAAPADPADEVVAPEESAPEVATPEVEADEEAADDVTPEAEEVVEESAPESGSSGSGSFPRFPNVSLPSIPLFIPTPQVEGVMFWAMGGNTKVTVMINEKSALALADVVEVKISYSFLGSAIADYATQGGLVGTNVWSWSVDDTVIANGFDVTITVKNAAGKTHTYTTVATLSAPL